MATARAVESLEAHEYESLAGLLLLVLGYWVAAAGRRAYRRY
jgi:hypothetical protein